MSLASLLKTKRKAFISYHHSDRVYVDQLIKNFGHLFIPKVLGANDNYEFIESSNTNYIMSQIRSKYLEDSTVTIVMMGQCTHSRRFVDWEIRSSLIRGAGLPNGLLGLIVPPLGTNAHLPARFQDNWTSGHVNCYSRYYRYPQSDEEFSQWIEDAYNARTSRSNFINNGREMMGYNAKCEVHSITH